jgi:hypothetical protein
MVFENIGDLDNASDWAVSGLLLVSRSLATDP